MLQTQLEPLALLDTVQAIERSLGRVRDEVSTAASRDGAPGSTPASRQYHSRPIDIDLLFYGDRIIDLPRLQIPHPLIAQRAFVLRPLAEVLPDYRHPVTGLTARDMLEQLEHLG